MQHLTQVETGRVFQDLKQRKRRGTLSASISFNWHRQLASDAAKKNFHLFRHSATDEPYDGYRNGRRGR